MKHKALLFVGAFALLSIASVSASQALVDKIFLPMVFRSIPPTPTSTPTSTPVPTQPPGANPQPTQSQNCDPSYPTVCIPPPPPDLDCGDIPYRNFTVLPPDPHNFDGDHDGIGCEN